MSTFQRNRIRHLASGIATVALLAGAHAGAAPLEFGSRGVFHFASASGCPATGLQAVAADCNRIALDIPNAHASVDAAAQTIVFSSEAPEKDEILVGDVLLQGSGVSEQGQRVPLSVQLLVRRDGKKWSKDVYARAPVAGKFKQVQIDAYTISARQGDATKVLFTPDQARKIFADPSLKVRLARRLVGVKPSDKANSTAGDITVSLGIGAVSTSVVRVGFAATPPAAGAQTQALASNWSIDVEALSSRIPLWAVQRELFLFGLEDQPALSGVRQNGFNNNDKLTIGAINGKGYLRFNGRETPFDTAAASGHAFMQDSFMGLILGWRHRQATLAPAAAQASLH